MANYPLPETGCADKFSPDQTLTINTELCGDWAGNVWNQYQCSAITGVRTCNEYVRAHGDKMTEAYWTINSLKIYTGSSGPSPPPSPSPSGKLFCMPKSGTSETRLNYDLEYACGQVGCSDYPSACTSLEEKSTWAISKYYSLKRAVGGTCDFANSAQYADESEA